MTREQPAQIFEMVLAAAKAAGVADVEASMGGGRSSLTRFANNTIHQNVSEQRSHLSVRAILDDRTARASTNRFDPESLRRVVEEAAAIARAQEPNPDHLPPAEPAPVPTVNRFSPATAASTPEDRAAAVAEAIRVVEREGQTAAGIYSATESFHSLYNSRGVAAWHTETLSQFSITAMAGDSSGWAKASFPDLGSFDPVALARRAAAKAKGSAGPRELPPGRYTVILEPSAVQDLVGQMFCDFSGTAMRDQRSFLNGRLGSRLFGENITIYDDVCHPLQAGAPFDAEGVPRKRLTLVEKGVPSEVAWCREAARREGVPPTGHGFPVPSEIGEAPVNIVIAGGDTSLNAMIASTERGILVTRFWYIREVDPYEKLMTGMTRDGTFLVENGKVACGVRNFRFNQSLIEMLSNVEALSPPERASGEECFDLVAPAMKVNGFNFSEVTRF